MEKRSFQAFRHSAGQPFFYNIANVLPLGPGDERNGACDFNDLKQGFGVMDLHTR
jgi:hypothetical protein